MPPVLAVASAVSAAVGVAGAVSQAKQAKKARKQQAKIAKEQKEAAKQAEVEAQEAADLDAARGETGAALDFGTAGAADELIKRSSARKKSGTKATSVGAAVSSATKNIGGL